MREIGTVAREQDARALADYLLTLDITTKLVANRDGAWAIWAHREERIPQARQVLEEFASHPDDPRFRSADPTAREIRKKAEKVERDYRKRVRDLRDRWEGSMYVRAPLAFALILASVVATGLIAFHPAVFSLLSFSVQGVDGEGFLHDSGFAEIRRGEVWRLITPIFLHGGIIHLFFNMVAMRVLGERVEMRKGTWRFALIALVAAVGGDVGQFFATGGGFGGMSGVVFALAGYLWIKGHVDPGDGLSLDDRSVRWMIGWFLLGIIAPMTATAGTPHDAFPYNMANVAHGVGLASGMLFGLLKL